METLNSLFTTLLFILIMSFALGLIVGGPRTARAIVAWEFKQLTNLARWALRQLLQLIERVCRWARRQL